MIISKSASSLFRLSKCHRIAVSSFASGRKFTDAHNGHISKISPVLLTTTIRFNSSFIPKSDFTFDVKKPISNASEPHIQSEPITQSDLPPLPEKEIIDLSHFLDVSEKFADQPDLTEILANSASDILTATDIGLTWWLPPGMFIVLLVY